MKFRPAIAALLLSGSAASLSAGPFDLVPRPFSIEKQEGQFVVSPAMEVWYGEELPGLAAAAAEIVHRQLGFRPAVKPLQAAAPVRSLILTLSRPCDPRAGAEGYELRVTPATLFLSANTPAGIFYGLQTLDQMLDEGGTLPACRISDHPRFPYRGMHLDVARHFMPVEFIYKTLDFLAMHKLNVFHWHLVDDQGWRLEIKKFPALTETGAWRVDREEFHWNSRPLQRPGEKTTYGGFYTQEEVKKIVQYARERYITVIPEIEMPAHAMAALAACPELSCTGQNLGVAPGGVWPITHIFCAGKEEVFNFLEAVLEETMDLFPSTFIHAGGDEANKTEWKRCPLCQERIRAMGLKDEQELQSYFMNRIGTFLAARGRTMIGWDEILEGGLAQEAAVMSWRGEEGGIAAARMGHPVIMTPSSHCYFDYYQGDPSLEPPAIGGFITLKKVYHYEPVPAVLSPEEGLRILGAQANLWTEYMQEAGDVEYMAFPRLAALAEVVWSPAGTRNWDDFSRRMESQYRRYDKAGIRYALSAFQVTAAPRLLPETKTVEVQFATEASNPEIRYTLDGTDPVATSPLYTGPVAIDHPLTAKAAVFKNGTPVTAPLSRQFFLHKAVACPVTLQYPNSPRYDGSGPFTLVDGIRGSSNFNDGKWKGFYKDDMVATLDLGKPTRIRSVETDAVQDIGSWIFMPTEVVVEVSSDGKSYKRLGSATHAIPVTAAAKTTHLFPVRKAASQVRYIRITARNLAVCPEGHAGAGKGAHLFVSEIIVN